MFDNDDQRYEFTYECKEDNLKSTMSFNGGISFDDLMRNFSGFLLSAGWCEKNMERWIYQEFYERELNAIDEDNDKESEDEEQSI